MRMCSCRGTSGFATCRVAEQAKICSRGEENNLGDKVTMRPRWHSCSLCEQNYHGVVSAPSGGRWKNVLGRPEELGSGRR